MKKIAITLGLVFLGLGLMAQQAKKPAAPAKPKTPAKPKAEAKPVTAEVKKEHLINWMTFEQATVATKKNPKPIFIDVYTKWCGPCKMMSMYTFDHPQVAEYMNDKFYCVKFDAETHDTVFFDALVTDTITENGQKKAVQRQQRVSFINQNPPTEPGQRGAPHQFAISILGGELSYPSLIFLNENIQRLDVVKGFHQPNQWEPIMKFFGSGIYKTIKWDEYVKTFQPAIVTPIPQ